MIRYFLFSAAVLAGVNAGSFQPSVWSVTTIHSQQQQPGLYFYSAPNQRSDNRQIVNRKSASTTPVLSHGFGPVHYRQPTAAIANQKILAVRKYLGSPVDLKTSPAALKFAMPALDNSAFIAPLVRHGIVRSPMLYSYNAPLPFSLNVTPINIAPLPLQAGASYASLRSSQTSYETYPPAQ